MPQKPKRPCRYPGCPGFCDTGQTYCKAHMDYSADRMRGSPVERGYDSKWREARKLFLRRNPLCAECLRQKRITAATVVDHIIPHRGDQRLFWDESNWQALCKECHDRKTGFGL